MLEEGVGVDLHGKLGHQNAGGAADEGGVDADAETEAVEYRHDGQHLHAVYASEAGGGDGLQAEGVKVQIG